MGDMCYEILQVVLYIGMERMSQTKFIAVALALSPSTYSTYDSQCWPATKGNEEHLTVKESKILRGVRGLYDCVITMKIFTIDIPLNSV